ncbi:hypothetical protein DPMN_045814 [Dreissena polymorpha]|uniref:Uncharacterized protein n=1 Tax=Dreissena polymorpha TaxID=45954 RepID=A0A9D4D6R5_DREPO|nr:hypothetical protein DPMN_045814 [Dreissena polymorpha]
MAPFPQITAGNMFLTAGDRLRRIGGLKAFQIYWRLPEQLSSESLSWRVNEDCRNFWQCGQSTFNLKFYFNKCEYIFFGNDSVMADFGH